MLLFCSTTVLILFLKQVLSIVDVNQLRKNQNSAYDLWRTLLANQDGMPEIEAIVLWMWPICPDQENVLSIIKSR